MIRKNLLSISALSLLLLACGSQKNEQEVTSNEYMEADSAIAVENAEVTTNEVGAVSIWDKVSVRAVPSGDGKWLTSVNLGETLTYLKEEATDDKDKKYYKVRLNDGKEGWVRYEFVVPEAKPAVFAKDADIYSRPDLLTKTNKKFSKMDIIAVKQTQGDWVEITGKRSDGQWIETGWAKTNNISFEQVDIAMAKFAKPVMDMKMSDEKAEKLEEVLNNTDLNSSNFMADIKAALDEIKFKEVEEPEMDEEMQEEVVEMTEDTEESMEESTEDNSR